MRLKILAVFAAAATAAGAFATPAAAQARHGRSATVNERITIIDETGRRTSRITVRPRSFLNPGTESKTFERSYMNYATPPNHTYYYDPNDWKGSWRRMPLPGPFDIPGYRNF